MAKKHSETELEVIVSNYLNNEDISFLYKQNFINWSGCSENAIPYSEIISRILIENDFLNLIKMIEPIKREEVYPERKLRWMKDKNTIDSHLRREEHIVYLMHDTNVKYSFGKMVNYQIPLKGKQNDKSGKIDFIAIDDIRQVVNLCEIKNDLSNETLLRCVLEIATYYQQLDYISFKRYMLDKFCVDYPIMKVVVIFKETKPYKDYCKLNSMPRLRKVIDLLSVKIVVLDSESTIKEVF